MGVPVFSVPVSGLHRCLRKGRGVFSLSLSLSLSSFSAAQPLTPIAPPPAASPVAVADSLKADSLARAKPLTRADTAMVIKHHFNHRQQIITGSAVMACAAMIMVVMNNYNPHSLTPSP